MLQFALGFKFTNNNKNTANSVSIHVTKVGHSLVLHDVLFVPQFELNLISVTSLTKDKTTMVSLYHDYAIIQ